MVAFPRSLGLKFGACQLVGHEALQFLSQDSSKPVRALSPMPVALCFPMTTQRIEECSLTVYLYARTVNGRKDACAEGLVA